MKVRILSLPNQVDGDQVLPDTQKPGGSLANQANEV